MQIVFLTSFQPSPTFLRRFSQKVTGGGCGQGFQVANEWTRGGETLRRLAIALFTNDSLNEQKVHHWSHQSKGLKSLSRARAYLASGIAALIGSTSMRNCGLWPIAAPRASVSQVITARAFIDHTITGTECSECSECGDDVCWVLWNAMRQLA